MVELLGENLLLEDDEEKFEFCWCDRRVWVELVSRVCEMGFCLDEIFWLCFLNLDWEEVVKFLLFVWLFECFNYGEKFEILIGVVVDVINEVELLEGELVYL